MEASPRLEPQSAPPKLELVEPIEDPRGRENILLMFDLHDAGKVTFDGQDGFIITRGAESVRISIAEVTGIQWEALDGIALAAQQPGLDAADDGLLQFFKLQLAA